MQAPDEVALEQIVVVPLAPGRLVDAARHVKARDEVDELVDDLFGPDDDASPGPLDIALVSGGLALIVADALWLESNVALASGIVLLVLGSILPLRAGWRAVRARRSRRRRKALLDRGLALNVDHPLTRSVAESYERLLVEASATSSPVKVEAMTAAHAAVVEIATLLGTTTPSSAAEEEYVRKRRDAIDAVTAAMSAARIDDAQRAAALDTEDARLERAARAQAGDELEALGISAVSDLETLTRAVRAVGRERDT